MFAELGDFLDILMFANGQKFVFPAIEKGTPSRLANAILVQLKCLETSTSTMYFTFNILLNICQFHTNAK